MKRPSISSALLWATQAAIGAWAFLKIQEPRHLLELLKLFSLC